MISQIGATLALSGSDMETGAEIGIEMRLLPRGESPVLLWPGAPRGMAPELWANLPHRDARRTLLGGEARQSVADEAYTDSGKYSRPVAKLPQELALTEHLMAAWLYFPRLPVAIHCPQGAIPLLDGSAQPFAEALAQLAQVSGRGPEAPGEYDSFLRLNWEWEGGFLRAEPSSAFRATYEVSRGEYRACYSMGAASDAYREVLPARTFIFSEDYFALRSQGRLSGVSAQSGLLLAETKLAAQRARSRLQDLSSIENPDNGLLHPAEYRFPDEAARHKMLDLLGDLALFGLRLPRLRLHLRNAGHHHHHRLLEALIHERAHP